MKFKISIKLQVDKIAKLYKIKIQIKYKIKS